MTKSRAEITVGDSVRLPSGEIVIVTARRSPDVLRVRYADGQQDSVAQWEPA
jgi:hypothetical protein